jgi:membrane-associated protease RseP (regulator of RpoE activity)
MSQFSTIHFILKRSLVLGLLMAGMSNANAQTINPVLAFLVFFPPQSGSSEELPAPKRSSQPDSTPGQLQDSPDSPVSGSGEQQTDGGIGIRGESEEIDPSDQIYLGLEAEELTDGVAGLRVAAVTRDSPAWKAGFQEGDRIVGINDYSITQMSDMVEQLGKTRPGQTVKFLITRAGRTRELVAVLISAAMADQLLSQPMESADDSAWIGLVVHDLTPSFQQQFGLAAFRGAAVSQVARNSPAQRAGIQAGDAITQIDGVPVDSAEDFVRWLQKSRPGDQVDLVVYRGITRIPMQIVLASEPRPQLSPPSFRPPSARSPVARSGRRTPPPPPQPSPPQSSPPQTSPPRTSQRAAGSDLSDVPLVPPPVTPPVTPSVTPPVDQIPSSEKSSREVELEAEIQRLREQLAEAQAKLAETRQQLNDILRALRD